MQIRCRKTVVLIAFAIATTFACLHVTAQTPTEQPDKYQWLEDVSGDKAMAWVNEENSRSAKVLQADPRYPVLAETALKVLESPTRLPSPDFRVGEIYNTWQDAQHVRGILRKTSLDSYLTNQPEWQTVIDYDALAAKDNEKWVEKGLNCLYPGDGLCLVSLSAGGEDADTLREFDLKTGKFVEGGFVLPKSKQDATWVDKDTLLIARDWGEGSMTQSGYPFVVKLWKRGQSLAEAKEVYRGTPADVEVGATAIHDSHGHVAVVIDRGVNFFERETYLYTDSGPKKIFVPGKSQLHGMLDGMLIVELNQDWKPEGLSRKFPQGSVVALDLEAVKKDPVHLKPTVVFTPTSEEFFQESATTKDHLLLTTLDHVQGRAYIYTHEANNTWTRKKLDIPDNFSVSIATTNTSDNKFFLETTGFLTPSSLLLGDAQSTNLKSAKTLPAQFDASNLIVEQLQATSKDGTKIPYFLVRHKDIKYDSSNPTLMNAYGGFQVSMTPLYNPILGKLWLERGGTFVLANIRGGGEFGPAWHDAGLKIHRQRIYDDFAAVGQDLFTRKITSPRRLGIVGGSNGGLLMGVEFTQHPEMWNAVVIQVPLLDMLRYEHIAAGASWVGEYGTVTIPAERKFLASISPYNQLNPNTNYPEPLIFTTTKDDRVGPVHARKFAARLEELHKPFFYDEIVEGGHAAGANLKEQANTRAEQYTYLTRKLMD
ncbi:prolyl oligopeptidase family serine peptidase [Tunturiibacter gelidoferens]|uniref:Prolyl oligopeptidase n=1 Tax=Tunturiibacter gelidiferens TaxID=3069689 RepID=A0ACC5NY11_9BACT|nr:prolyl oligopeptidase family serine peptidase [Edaphobacter lichenicola]MBB5339462.1 prolyl oligopeptidase [Edaphobacter lichenicola]